MKRWIRTTWVWAVGGAVLLVGGYLVLKWLGLDANAIAAVAAAGAAIAAFGSAAQSSATARDAVRALSWPTKPTMNADASIPPLSPTKLVYIQNDSIHPVESAKVRWTLGNGHTGEQELGELRGRDRPKGDINLVGSYGVHYEAIDLGAFDGRESPDRFEIEYRGTNGPTTWRTVILISYRPNIAPDGSIHYSVAPQRVSDYEVK